MPATTHDATWHSHNVTGGFPQLYVIKMCELVMSRIDALTCVFGVGCEIGLTFGIDEDELRTLWMRINRGGNIAIHAYMN